MELVVLCGTGVGRDRPIDTLVNKMCAGVGDIMNWVGRIRCSTAVLLNVVFTMSETLVLSW